MQARTGLSAISRTTGGASPLRRRKVLALCSVIALAALLLAMMASSAFAAPTVTSDLPDYAPGATVYLSGSGWMADPVVHLKVAEVSNWSPVWSWEGDALVVDGGFVSSLTLPDWFVAQYKVTATGASGAYAETTFTDSGGAYNFVWTAADPALQKAPYLPTYTKKWPHQVTYPLSGRQDDPMADAVMYGPTERIVRSRRGHLLDAEGSCTRADRAVGARDQGRRRRDARRRHDHRQSLLAHQDDQRARLRIRSELQGRSQPSSTTATRAPSTPRATLKSTASRHTWTRSARATSRSSVTSTCQASMTTTTSWSRSGSC